MSKILNILSNTWYYIINHRWSKDIFRANLFYVFLIIIYDLFHFSLKVIGWHVFFKIFFVMNLCLIFKFLLDGIDRYLKARKQL